MNQNPRRNRRLATLLNILGQTIAIITAAILGRTVYHHTAGHGYWTMTAATITVLGILLTVSTLADHVLGPTIDRLRGTDTTEAGQ